MSEATLTPPTEPKYSPRSAAADFTAGLPKLGVEAPAPAAIAPIEQDPPPAPEPKPTPPEPKPAAAPAPVEEKIPRTQKDWESYKAKQKEREAARETEFATLQSKIKELESKPNPTAVDDSRLKALEQEREELSEKLRLVDITNHPQFKAYYEGKTNAQIELAKRIAGPERADAIAKALALPDGEFRQANIEELLREMTPLQVSRVGAVLNSLNEIESDRSAQIEKAKGDYTLHVENAKKQAESQKTEAIQKAESAFTNIVSAAQNPKDKDGSFIFQKIDGNEEWNKGVDERIAYAKSLLFGNHAPEVLIKRALDAAALPAITKAYQGSLARIAELESQVKGLSTAQPALNRREATEGGEGGHKSAGAEKKRGGFLDGRGQAGSWVKSLAESQAQE